MRTKNLNKRRSKKTKTCGLVHEQAIDFGHRLRHSNNRDVEVIQTEFLCFMVERY